jgi:hypothetical protein
MMRAILLIYKIDDDELYLVRTGTSSDQSWRSVGWLGEGAGVSDPIWQAGGRSPQTVAGARSGLRLRKSSTGLKDLGVTAAAGFFTLPHPVPGTGRVRPVPIPAIRAATCGRDYSPGCGSCLYPICGRG